MIRDLRHYPRPLTWADIQAWPTAAIVALLIIDLIWR